MSELPSPGRGSPPATPAGPPPQGCLGRAGAVLSVVLGALYVVNPGAGVLELIPDLAPFVGNLDEAAATTMLVLGLQRLFGRGRTPPGPASGSAEPPPPGPADRQGD